MIKESVKLGVMPPLTGLVGIYGREISHAAQIACDEVNRDGGVLGRPLEIIIEDDGSLPDTSVKAAEKLIDTHECSAIIGNLLSNSRIAVAYRVAEPRKIPYLNFSFYEGSILSRYFFHFAALPNQQIHRMIPYMKNIYGSRMFFAGNNYEWPRGSIAAGKEALLNSGGEVVGEAYLPIGVSDSDIDNLLDDVERASPDVFVPYFAGSDQVLLLTRFTERKLKDKIAVVMGHYDEMMASQLTPEVRDGFYSSNTYFMSINNKKNHEYLSSLSNLDGVDGVWPNGNGILTNFGEGVYVCVKAFAKAANKAGSLESEDLIEVLSDISVDAPQGHVSMSSEHHHAIVNTYLSRCNCQGVFEIIESFGALEPAIPARYNHQRILHETTLEDDIRLQARILEQLSEAVFLLSTDTNEIVFTNSGAEKLFKYGKVEMNSISIEDIVGNSAYESQKNSFQDIRLELQRTGSWVGDVVCKNADQITLHCSITASTFTHPYYGEVWLLVVSDITRLKNAEEELKNHRANLESIVEERTGELVQARDEAKNANRIKSEFLSHMSHELRTPMNSIMGFAQVLELSSNTEENKDYINEILIASGHLLTLINELLDLSRIETGNLFVAKDYINISEAINDVVKILSPMTKDRNISISINGNEGLGVLADSTRLKQTLLNLLSNAIKYNRQNGSINIRFFVKDINTISVSISDTGIGIPIDMIEKVFTPFERLGAENSNVDGVGIGLSLSKKLVELMGGDIYVNSIPGSGSKFTFELPRSGNNTDEVMRPVTDKI
ncbi:MAG: transporter substrate-binding protein [Gammaproteobacteria bacterium]|nr:transporter substrate-binding protein [Gammaproteobacteria bacterium]